jgi:hypothetical protein
LANGGRADLSPAGRQMVDTTLVAIDSLTDHDAGAGRHE